MGKMIGCAKELEGLYYLETKSGNGGHGSHPHFSEKVPSNIIQVWLHHLCLQHPPFALLKTTFPLLFGHLNVNEFHCEFVNLLNIISF